MRYIINHFFYGLESTCDDTGAALYLSHLGLYCNIIRKQCVVHSLYGGVVPRLAAAEHFLTIIPIIRYLLTKKSLRKPFILFSFTATPGLLQSLYVVASFIRCLHYRLRIPFFMLNHLECHILSVFIGKEEKITYPFLCFVLSGGNTVFISVFDQIHYSIIGRTNDDSVGEVFDKIARFLGFYYQGASVLEKNTFFRFYIRNFAFFTISYTYCFFNVSFSGLKTYFRQHVCREFLTIRVISVFAVKFQLFSFVCLLNCCVLLFLYTGLCKLVISGGVSCNLFLKKEFVKMKPVLFYLPLPTYVTDNAAMVAWSYYYKISVLL